MCENGSRKRQRARIKHRTVVPERRKAKRHTKKSIKVRQYSAPSCCNNCFKCANRGNCIKITGGNPTPQKPKHRTCNFPPYKLLCMILITMFVAYIAINIICKFPPLLAKIVLDIIESSLNIASKIFDILKILYEALKDR